MTSAKLCVALIVLPLSLPAQSVTLTLGGAARMAVQRSGMSAIARTRVEQAEARVRQARSALLPTFSAGTSALERNQNTATFGFSFRDPQGKPVFNPNGQVLPAYQVIDVRGRAQASLVDLSVIAKLHAMRSQVGVAEAEAVGAGDQAGVLAATAYVRAARADAALGARIADSTLAAELVSIASDLVKAGVGVALDVTRARSQLAASRAQLISARNERDRAGLELRRAIGLEPGTEFVLADSLMALPVNGVAPTAEEATRVALSRRADIRSAVAQKRASEQQAEATRLERFPTMGVFGDQGAVGGSVSHMLNTYQWGVQLSVPVFDGFRRAGRVQEQRAQVQEADARRRDLEAQATIDVRSALLDLASAREMLVAAEERMVLAQQELQQARERFTAGVSGNADVITASLGINAARMLQVDARAAVQTAFVMLARAQGAVTDLP